MIKFLNYAVMALSALIATLFILDIWDVVNSSTQVQETIFVLAIATSLMLIFQILFNVIKKYNKTKIDNENKKS